MTEYIFKNAATGSLNSSIGTADVTLTLKSGEGAGFPSPGTGEVFNLIVFEGGTYEWMVCTSRSGDVLTVTRGGTPYAFNADADVHHRLHEDALNNMLQKGSERSVVTSPDGSLAASYAGEEVKDTTTGIWWKHITGTTWKAMNS